MRLLKINPLLGSAKIHKRFKIVIFEIWSTIKTQNKSKANMAAQSKSSMKRSKPSYFMAILGVALVLFILGMLANTAWFYTELGVNPDLANGPQAMALVLFMMVLPYFTFPTRPVMSWMSRKHEFEADAYAAQQSAPQHLVSALVKLYQDNASTLTPDPLHSAFYDSHPPASIRINRLNALQGAQ